MKVLNSEGIVNRAGPESCAYIGAPIERCLHDGDTSQNRMGGNARWGSPRWKISKAFCATFCWWITPYKSESVAGFGPDEPIFTGSEVVASENDVLSATGLVIEAGFVGPCGDENRPSLSIPDARHAESGYGTHRLRSRIVVHYLDRPTK